MNRVWRDDLGSWGRVLRARHLVSAPGGMEEAGASVGREALPVLGYGCGRSYGDSPLNPDGRLVDMRRLNRFIAFDRVTGVLTCEAGVTLAEILAVVCRPEGDGGGWFLPVSPGSRFVTVGGAIANDVHGKNHHRFSTFGAHVVAFDLARSDGGVVACSALENGELFAATIGGMGLTGLILRASLRLRRVAGLAMEAEDVRFDDLAGFFALAGESEVDWEYTAAWIDCLATGAQLGRGIFSRARHVAGRSAVPPSRAPRLNWPLTLPVSLANSVSVRAFNALYLRRLGRGGRARRIGGYDGVLYPLDAIGNWNRVYGRAGFFQFQCVVPPDVAPAAIAEMLRLIAASGQGSMLSVLKTFGDLPSPGMLSFPMPGATLALDFPNKGASTRGLLAALERVTLDAGGRLYPAKDGVMTAAGFHDSNPALQRFLPHVDPAFSSAFARRVAIVPGFSTGPSSMDVDVASSSPVVAIFGAGSDIAAALARRYGERGCRLVLIGRNAEALAAQAADLSVRGAVEIDVQHADFGETRELAGVADRAWERFGRLDVAIVAYGTLPDQSAAEADGTLAEQALAINFTSPVLLLNALARRFQAQGQGAIAVISSVAGDRGRKSNHLYGAAKGGLQRYLQGLRHRLHGSGVSVLDVRPGFVSTKMTAHLNGKGPLWATPAKVAADIDAAVQRRRAVLYTPWFWAGVMAVVRLLPRFVFHRSNL